MTIKAKFIGYNPPIFGGHQNILSRQADERLVKNDLLQLLLTSPGERTMRPDFGTILKKSLFEPLDDLLIADIRGDINKKIERFEPRINATSTIRVNKDESTLTVIVIGVFSNEPNRSFEAEINVPLQIGELT